MQGAILIFGNAKKERVIKASEIAKNAGFDLEKNSSDLLKLSVEKGKNSIGIEKAREIQKFLSQKPYESDKKVIFVEDAHLLTVQAQNALLKTLEELPTFATVILECANKKSLLETVVSRCQLIKLQEKTQRGTDLTSITSWDKIKKLSNGAKLDLVEKICKKERIEVINLLENWINCEREEMKKTETKKELGIFKQNLEILMTIRNDFAHTNVNLALGLDLLLLTLR